LAAEVTMTTVREYVGPVRPQRGARWDAWCHTQTDAEQSAEWREGFNHAMRTMALWLDFQVSALPREVASELRRGPGLSSIGMLKSNLLGRLMRDHEIRRVPCPVHRGKLQYQASSFGTDVSCCDGTGWLRNAPDGSESDPEPRKGTHWLTHAWKQYWWSEAKADGPG
jgi:hypothetical protein